MMNAHTELSTLSVDNPQRIAAEVVIRALVETFSVDPRSIRVRFAASTVLVMCEVDTYWITSAVIGAIDVPGALVKPVNHYTVGVYAVSA